MVEKKNNKLINVEINEKTFKELLPFLKLDLKENWDKDKLFIYSFK